MSIEYLLEYWIYKRFLHNNIVLITQDLLRYKILLDQEIF